jgi:protein-S-isoprenylcysteine O-methyltransferase Ste14
VPSSLPFIDPSRRRLAIIYGTSCHTLFVVAVASAMVAMYHGMAQGYVVHWGRAGSLLWDTLLLLQFPLVHSFLLSSAGNKWLLRLAPKAVARDLSTTLFTMVASLQMIALYLLWSPVGPTLWEAHGAVKVSLSLAYLASWLFLAKAMHDSGLATQTGFLGWSAVFRGQKPRYGGMPESGLFRHVRHPVYLAFAVIMWCVPVWTADQLVLAFWFTAYCLLGPLLKEKRYLKRYGQKFVDYRQRVPYFLPALVRAKGRGDGDGEPGSNGSATTAPRGAQVAVNSQDT